MQTGLALTDPLVGARRFRRGLSEPGFETGLAELRAIAGKECPLANDHAVVARGHSYPAMARNSARPVSKPGSLSPRRKRRAPTSGSVKARPVCVNRPHSN